LFIALARNEADRDGPLLDEIEPIRRLAGGEQDLPLPVVTFLEQRRELAKLPRRERLKQSQIPDVPDRVPLGREARPNGT
jgi:hypothetical protein